MWPKPHLSQWPAASSWHCPSIYGRWMIGTTTGTMQTRPGANVEDLWRVGGWGQRWLSIPNKQFLLKTLQFENIITLQKVGEAPATKKTRNAVHLLADSFQGEISEFKDSIEAQAMMCHTWTWNQGANSFVWLSKKAIWSIPLNINDGTKTNLHQRMHTWWAENITGEPRPMWSGYACPIHGCLKVT